MSHTPVDGCDEQRLDRLVDGDLGVDEKARLQRHLTDCRSCRRQAAALAAVSRQVRDRVEQATQQVDFSTLEKAVVNGAHRQRHSQAAPASWLPGLKISLPVAAAAVLLVFWAYSHFLGAAAPAPSAIINSFTGPMSSVMFFETPQTRQTIIWFKEDAGADTEPNPV